ncbi:MAG: 50S ribosomal protein L28 [Longimicrobiales bacterium]
MSRRCSVTGKGPLTGYNVSHAHNKTKKRQLPNLQRKRIFVPELGKTVRVRVSTSALRSIDKVGLVPFLKKNGLTLRDIT